MICGLDEATSTNPCLCELWVQTPSVVSPLHIHFVPRVQQIPILITQTSPPSALQRLLTGHLNSQTGPHMFGAAKLGFL